VIRLVTDMGQAFKFQGFAAHETVDHSKYEWSRGDVHTNTLEGFFSVFRGSCSTVICSTFGGKRLSPFSTCENLNESSAMATLMEGHVFGKLTGWAKNAFTLVKRVATLEARVTALEQGKGGTTPYDCPYCTERGMRKTKDGRVLGGAPYKWKEDVWTCQKCGKTEVRTVRL
jgi:ribosomal protein L37AE/L43A